MSEQILLLNPRRRRKHSKRRRRHNRRPRHVRRRHRAAPRARRHNRRRRQPQGFTFRRRRRHNRRHRVHASRRRRRHNRRMFGMGGGGGSGLSIRGALRNYLMPGVIGAGGAVALDYVWSYVAPRLPAQLQAGWVGVLAKSATAIIGVALLGKILPARMRRAAHVAGVGAVTMIAVRQLVPLLPATVSSRVSGLGGYIDYQSYALPGAQRMHGYMSRAGTLGDLFSPAAVIQPQGVPVPRQFGGYVAVQPHVMGNGGLMGYDWSADGM